jgi:hypothetical protein
MDFKVALGFVATGLAIISYHLSFLSYLCQAARKLGA